ncbi:MAG: hypothetical protein R2783_05005 [Gelidibacter sp.]
MSVLLGCPEKFRGKSKDIDFDIKKEYKDAVNQGMKSITAIERSIEQHSLMCMSTVKLFGEAKP